MKYFSLFSGIGGFELGIQRAMPEAECVGYSEVDKYAEAIYRQHFPEHRGFGDATGIIPDTIPDFDLLVAGFPCQSFSVAGKRRGFQDTRGTLFFEIVRILRHKRPRYFLLENVKGLLSSGHGETFQTILGVLSDAGYLLQWEVLNSRNYGVPQNRDRVFIVGHLRGEPRPEVFPIGEGCEASGEESPGSYPLDASYAKGAARASRQMIGIANALSVNKGYYGQATGLYCVDEGATNRHGKAWFQEETPTCGCEGRLYVSEEPLQTTREVRQAKKQGKIRRLTLTECERLQGFPDGWTEYGIIGGEEAQISDTQRYKVLGNAVTTNVVEYIIQRFDFGS